jgi:hypothetical protein
VPRPAACRVHPAQLQRSQRRRQPPPESRARASPSLYARQLVDPEVGVVFGRALARALQQTCRLPSATLSSVRQCAANVLMDFRNTSSQSATVGKPAVSPGLREKAVRCTCASGSLPNAMVAPCSRVQLHVAVPWPRRTHGTRKCTVHSRPKRAAATQPRPACWWACVGPFKRCKVCLRERENPRECQATLQGVCSRLELHTTLMAA